MKIRSDINSLLKWVLILIFISITQTAYSLTAYPDSSKTFSVSRSDTVTYSRKTKRDPRRASLLSAVFPGAGQLYNKKYWKLPILYGGSFALGYFIDLNNDQYKLFRNAYVERKSGKEDIFKGRFNEEQLVRQREYWRRNRDLLIIVSAFTYLLNIADAAVDAHLSEFDVSDDLSMSVYPKVEICNRKAFTSIGLLVTLH